MVQSGVEKTCGSRQDEKDCLVAEIGVDWVEVLPSLFAKGRSILAMWNVGHRALASDFKCQDRGKGKL